MPMMTVFDSEIAAVGQCAHEFGLPDEVSGPEGRTLQWLDAETGEPRMTLLVNELTPGRWIVREMSADGKGFKTLTFGDAV